MSMPCPTRHRSGFFHGLLQRRPVKVSLGLLLAACTGLAAAAGERGPSRTASLPEDDGGGARVIVKYRSSGRVSALSAGMASAASTASADSTGTADVQRAASMSSRLGLKLGDGPAVGPRHQVLTASGMSSRALAARLSADSEVEYAVPSLRRRAHGLIPSDPRYSGASSQSPAAGQWYLRAPDSTFISAVNAPAAWARTTGSASVVVAVLDTGVRADHPDLAGKLLPGYDFVSRTLYSVDGDGRDGDPSDPGDWTTEVENNTVGGPFYGCGELDDETLRYYAAPSSWHGTQTSGIVAAATNNNIGIAGLGRNVRVLPVRVLGKCFGYDDDILAGIRWAAGIAVAGAPINPNPASVINLSLGSRGDCANEYNFIAYREAINEVLAKGVTVVVSAGNDSLAVNAPASCPGVVAVAGIRHVGTKIGYSSLGNQVTLSAPGGNCVNTFGECLYPITSSSNTGLTTPVSAGYTSGGGDAAVGTSFAAPQVSATAALMLSANPTLSPAQVQNLLKSTARSFPTTGADTDEKSSTNAACLPPSAIEQGKECYCTQTTCGAGMLDAGAAVTAAASGRLVANIVDELSLIALNDSRGFDALQSSPGTGYTLTGRTWSLTSGASFATLGAGSGSSTTLTAKGDATVLLQLTVTDSSGASASSTAVVSTGSGGDNSVVSDDGGDSSGGGGGGGGGAFNTAELALLGLALLGAAVSSRRNNRSRGD
jgi:serine protease